MADNWSLTQLQQAGIGLLPSFTLEPLPGHPLSCQQIYRHLPGKRLTFSSCWADAQVMVKLFFRRKDFEAECAGLAAMRAAGVVCPATVWTLSDDGDRKKNNSGYFLALELIDNAISLQQYFHTLPVADFGNKLAVVLEAVGRLHRSGFVQSDIHLDNFIFQGDALFAVDGGGVLPIKTEDDAKDNVALLFAQMPPTYDALAPELLSHYGDITLVPDILLPRIAAMRERRIGHYLKKTVRDCTQFERVNTPSAFVMVSRSHANKALLSVMKEPEAVMGSGQFLKQGNTATVMRVSKGQSDWVLKRYNIKSFWHGLSRCWRPSRAHTSWQSAHRLELLGVPTPQPLGLRENRLGPLRREAYLLTEHVDGDSLKAWVMKHSANGFPPWLDAQLVAIFSAFWGAQVTHGDTKATNFIVADECLYVIDLDGLQRYRFRWHFVNCYRDDLQRFMDNWQGQTWQHFAEVLRPLADDAGMVLRQNIL